MIYHFDGYVGTSNSLVGYGRPGQCPMGIPYSDTTKHISLDDFVMQELYYFLDFQLFR